MIFFIMELIQYNAFKQLTDKAKKLGYNFDNIVDPYEGMIIQPGLRGVAEYNLNYWNIG
jgi:hypothetical protein